jgi:hypothetical protein
VDPHTRLRAERAADYAIIVSFVVLAVSWFFAMHALSFIALACLPTSMIVRQWAVKAWPFHKRHGRNVRINAIRSAK